MRVPGAPDTTMDEVLELRQFAAKSPKLAAGNPDFGNASNSLNRSLEMHHLELA